MDTSQSGSYSCLDDTAAVAAAADTAQCMSSLLSDSLMLQQTPATSTAASVAESRSASAAATSGNRMKVYLRVRPITDGELATCPACASIDNQNGINNNIHTTKSSNNRCFIVDTAGASVLTRAPVAGASSEAAPPDDCAAGSATSAAASSSSGGSERVTNRFAFSGVFDESVDQAGLYAGTVAETVRQLAVGGLASGLVFNYGVTSSGKTFTVQGTPQSPGLLPRALSDLFRRLACTGRLAAEAGARSASLLPFRPVSFNETAPMTSAEVAAALEDTKAALNRFEPNDAALGDWRGASLELHDSEAAVADQDEPADPDRRYSVWVSCAEIYNEIVYDLLEPISRRRPNRTALELRSDRTGSVYVKGLRCLPVSSADEAYRLVLLGKQNQQVAATKLNQQSSRSHALFAIRLVRCVKKPEPQFSQVSSLTFCDLAGSERQRGAGTAGQGDRTREAGSINSSLLTLRRCVETLQRNQRCQRASLLVPFRDSKLTRLLQPYFSGSGRAAMIVNISQCPALFDETVNALKFSSLARSVIVSEPTPKRLRLAATAAATAAAARASPGYGLVTKSSLLAAPTGGSRVAQQLMVNADEDQDKDGEACNDEDGEALDVTYADEEEAEMADLAQMNKQELLAVITLMRQSRRQVEEAMEAREISIRRELIAERDRLMETMEERFETQLQDQRDQLLDQQEERLKEYLDTSDRLAARRLDRLKRRGEAQLASLQEKLGDAVAKLDQQELLIASLTEQRDSALLRIADLESRHTQDLSTIESLKADLLLRLRRIGDFQRNLHSPGPAEPCALGGPAGDVAGPIDESLSRILGSSD